MRNEHLCGWINRPDWVAKVLETLPMPILGDHDAAIRGSGAGKVTLLYKCVEKVMGTFPQREQTIGDCVSMGAAYATDTLACTEIVLGGERETWPAEAATEPIYAGSRVEVGKGRLGNGDGSVGAWGAEWIAKWGILLRKIYGDIDLTIYSGAKARDWGRASKGCPDSLEPIAKEHPVKTVSLVTTYEQARDAIANGFPVTVASMQGFNSTRDAEGFCKAQGSWAHQMSFLAADDEHKRPGLLCQNSWGPTWVSGLNRHEQPDGSFWVDADVANKMLKQADSFAISNFDGFPEQSLDHLLI